jgi:hypothetical protein
VSFDLIFDGISGPVAGGPIEGATVSVDDTDLEATTDADGNYTITGAPAGTWDVTASADGFDSETIDRCGGRRGCGHLRCRLRARVRW